MKDGLKILQFYQSSTLHTGWGIELANNLNDSFQQLEAIVPEFIYHDVSHDSIVQTLTKLEGTDYVLVSVGEEEIEDESFLIQLNQLLSNISLAKVLKVIVSPFDQQLLPETLKRHTSYVFHHAITGEPLLQKNYWYKLVDLTYDILRGDGVRNSLGAVYLAETINKFKFIRDEVKRELLRRGYEVFPKETYELESEQPTDIIHNNLSNSVLSVHIIGSGDTKNITDENVSDKQNMIASDYCLTHPELKRIVWVSEDSEDIIEDEYLYIEQLKRDKQVLHGAEIVQIPVEKLKFFVVNFLKSLLLDNVEVEVNKENKKSVYLICDQEDIKKSEVIVSWLEARDLFVVQTDFGEEQMKIFQHHRNNLAVCDSILIFHSRNNLKWIQMKLSDLRKAPGYGRVSPLLATGLYLENEEMLNKLSTIESNVLLLSSDSDLNQEKVIEFCEKIEEHA
tara:strand:- start:400 stop:1752 length:1353 start_codon:yes stop_codon:yes gene_type:complete